MVTEPSGGGSGRHVVDLSRELSRRGYSVHVVYAPNRAEKRFEEELWSSGLAKVTALPMRRAVGPWDLNDARRLRGLIHAEGPYSIIHAHSSKAGALARVVAPRSTTRIYTPHAFRTMDPLIGASASIVYGSIETFLARSCTDGVIAVSQDEYDHAIKLGIPSSKVFLVQNGIPPHEPALDRAKLRNELNIPAEAIVVGFVGRMSQQKNPLRFVEAVIAANESDPRICGVMIGEGELYADVERAVAGKLILLGNRNARQYMPAFDMFVMTSNYEAMPYVLIEALHAGLPIISTAVGGATSTVHHDENGLVLPVDVSPHRLSEAIVELVKGDRQIAFAAASRVIAEAFTATTMAEQTLAVYETCIRSKRQ